MKHVSRYRALAGLAVVAWLGAGCGRDSSPSTKESAAPPVPAKADPSPTDATRAAVRPLRQAWVTVYDPARASNGYTLTIHDRRVPVLLDMNGRVVHAWPEARVKSRVRLLPDGSILGLGLGRSVVEYDWNGRKTWELHTEGAIPHHDVVRLANGNTLVLVLRAGEGTDTLLEVDRAAHAVWTWRAKDHLGKLLPAKPAHRNDVTHVNSVQELPQNPWFASGDERFRPGNLLLSARNLNTVLIVDRKTGGVVWSYTGALDRQHEALMIPPGLPGAGRIQIFDNRPESYFGEHASAIVEIDPRRREVVATYRTPGFFTPTGGTQQQLSNGNLLITSTRGGRVFEVAPDGAVVWQWVPPYEPVRAVRVAPDACPQLASLERPLPRPVVPASGYLYVDSDAYRFARRGSRRLVSIDGERRSVLAESRDCRDLLLPSGATLDAGYGIDRERLRRLSTGKPFADPEFVLSLRARGSNADVVLLRDSIGFEGPAWRQKTLKLDAFALRPVHLCVSIEGADRGGSQIAFWEQPDIGTTLDRERAASEAHALDGLTPEEREAALQHLRSLGYVN